MKAYGFFAEIYEQAKETVEFKLEGLELEITEKILAVMEKKSISKTALAKKLGISKAALSGFFQSGSNVTLKRLLKIADALDCELRFDLQEVARATSTGKVIYHPRFKHDQFRASWDTTIHADDYGQTMPVNSSWG
jgi:DNA-binding Xre family transcriptional regulator